MKYRVMMSIILILSNQASPFASFLYGVLISSFLIFILLPTKKKREKQLCLMILITACYEIYFIPLLFKVQVVSKTSGSNFQEKRVLFTKKHKANCSKAQLNTLFDCQKPTIFTASLYKIDRVQTDSSIKKCVG